MASQFIRLTCYGAQAGAKRKQHENAFDILDEAARMPGAAPHIRSPKPPTLLHGNQINSVKVQLAAFAKVARGERGGPIRRGGALIYALVASYPIPWRQLEPEDALDTYGCWKKEVTGWLKAKFGAHLRSVVEHIDEGQPHLHAVIIPPLCPRNRIDHKLHPGRAARALVLGAGGDRLAGERAYRAGMRTFQYDFYNSVSAQFGHTRVGPKRKRFSRDVALARQASGLFLERAGSITSRLLAQIDAMPDIASTPERTELSALADLFAQARNQLLAGRFDALEALDFGLTALAGIDTDTASGNDKVAKDPLVDSVSPNWEADDDPRPEDFQDLDLNDDPDVDALVHDGDGEDENWDAGLNDDLDDDGLDWDEDVAFDPDDNR